MGRVDDKNGNTKGTAMARVSPVHSLMEVA